MDSGKIVLNHVLTSALDEQGRWVNWYGNAIRKVHNLGYTVVNPDDCGKNIIKTFEKKGINDRQMFVKELKKIPEELICVSIEWVKNG
ncbi:putative secreted protein [Methanococcus maripaludis]|jgi:predicted secreted protein|uniref:Uncharacterized protein n=2 Tax=Methanococcus maripaludis TaxID=39152 RepID=G0H437_METMI|nr:hypothetical protein [Methanococcus maripaludis]AEK19503.1 hypothetical protein GYY_03120 [Methanococcus maripaludis X1]MBA2846483.1 putative secreted protein [Methanococcus maripaludis]